MTYTTAPPSTYTDAEGRYRLIVPPGKHFLLVLGPSGDYVSQVIGSQQVAEGRPGGTRLFPDAYREVDVPAGGANVSFELRRGATIRGRLVGPGGEAIDQAVMVNPIYHYPYQENLAAQLPTIAGGEFEIHGCDPEQTYRVSFFDPKRRWGTTVQLAGNETSPVTVRLEPCAVASQRYVYQDGQPAGRETVTPSFYLIINDGPSGHPIDGADDQRELFANGTLLANLDRERYMFAKTDHEGRLEIQLIPGATYRILSIEDGKLKEKELKPRAGERIDLGDETVQLRG